MKGPLRSRLFFLFKLVVSAGLVYLLISTRDLDRILATLGKASLPVFLLSLGVFFSSHLLGIAQWRVFLGGARIPVSFFRATVYYYTGIFFNNFLFSSVGGDAVRVFDVAHGEKAKTGNVIAAILTDRIFGLVCLVLIGNGILLYFLLTRGLPDRLVLFSYGFMDIGIIGGVLAFASRRVRYFMYYLVKKLPGRSFRFGLFHLLEVLSAYRHDWRVFLRALPWGAGNQIMKMGGMLLVALSLDGSGLAVNPLPYCLVFIPILGIVKILPLSIMGLGPHEFAGERLFATAGILSGWSLPFLFLSQIMVMSSNLLGGFFFLFKRRKESPSPGGAESD